MIIYLMDELPKQYTAWDNTTALKYLYSEIIQYNGKEIRGDWHVNTEHINEIVVLFLMSDSYHGYFAIWFNHDLTLKRLAEKANTSLVEYARKAAKYYKENK